MKFGCHSNKLKFDDVTMIYMSYRPISQAGRPVSGFIRPGTQSGQSSSLEQALKVPRTAMTARLATPTCYVMKCCVGPSLVPLED